VFTIFHLFALAAFAVGGVLGARLGFGLWGIPGGIGGALAGAGAGLIAGRIPFRLVLYWLARGLKSKSSAELRDDLHRPDCEMPNLVLLELARRGEDIHCELPVVLDLLVSENSSRRCLGFAALTSAFPELAGQIRDYRLYESVDECRQKTEILRRLV
jgi:hypothetical protein